MRARKQEAKIALLVSMQKPVARVGTRIEWLDQAEVAIDADEEHRAVDAVSLDVRRMMIWRPEPRARLGDDRCALFGTQIESRGARAWRSSRRFRPPARRGGSQSCRHRSGHARRRWRELYRMRSIEVGFCRELAACLEKMIARLCRRDVHCLHVKTYRFADSATCGASGSVWITIAGATDEALSYVRPGSDGSERRACGYVAHGPRNSIVASPASRIGGRQLGWPSKKRSAFIVVLSRPVAAAARRGSRGSWGGC